MRPTPRTSNQRSRRTLLALTTVLTLPALAHAQDITTALYPDDATGRAVCETAMTHGEGARNRYQATTDGQQDRTFHPHVVAINNPIYYLAFTCENNATQALGRTFTTPHVEGPECARRLAAPAADRPTTLALVRSTPPAPPQREAA